MTTFTISAFESIIDVTELLVAAAKLGYRISKKGYEAGIFAVACIWYVGLYAFYLGQAVGTWYYQRGGDEVIATQLAPTVAAAKFGGKIVRAVAAKVYIAAKPAIARLESKVWAQVEARTPRLVLSAIAQA